MAQWAAAGIDDVRIIAQWQAIAPGNSEVRAPAGFNSADPNSPGYDWSRVDRAVDLVSAAGMHPMLVVTGPGPVWASQVPARHNVRYKPRPDLFAQFARAAALRYAGAVDRWIIWNEPNLPLWLQPQNTCKGSRCTPYAPHLYRRLVRAAYPAIKTVDPTSTVLFGALAPNGENPTKQNARTRPLAFIRSMGCVKVTLKRDRSGPCKGFKPLTGDGLAYHPHATKLAPDEQQSTLDNASIGDVPRLERTLDATQRAGGLKKPGGGQVPPVLHRVGLPDAPARPHARRHAGAAVALSAAGRVPRLSRSPRPAPDAVRVARRAGPPQHRRRRLRGLAVGPALRQRQAQAGVEELRQPVLHRPAAGQPQRSAVGPGAPWRDASGDRAAAQGGLTSWTTVKVLSTNGSGFWTLRQTVTGPPTTASAGSRPTSTGRRPAR